MDNVFKFIEPSVMETVLREATRAQFSPEQVILAEDQQRRAVFLIESGVVRVERGHMGFSVEISRLGPGEIFGERSFVEVFGTSASIVANELVNVAIIDGKQVKEMVAASPEFYGQFYHSIAEILSRRLRETTVRSIAEYSWGGASEQVLPPPSSLDDWGGGSPLRDNDDKN